MIQQDPQPLTRLATPRPCDALPCTNMAYWYFTGGARPAALCLPCMSNMARMNSDNAEAFAPALDSEATTTVMLLVDQYSQHAAASFSNPDAPLRWICEFFWDMAFCVMEMVDEAKEYLVDLMPQPQIDAIRDEDISIEVQYAGGKTPYCAVVLLAGETVLLNLDGNGGIHAFASSLERGNHASA